MAVLARILTGLLTYGLGAVLLWLAGKGIIFTEAEQQWLKENVPTVAYAVAGVMMIVVGVIYTKYLKPWWDQWTGKTVLLLLVVPLLGMGCTTQARHEYTVEACNLVLTNTDSMQTLALDYSTAAAAKALQDLKRLDDALMLAVERIAKTVYADDAARQADILKAMVAYKTDVAAVETDRERVRDRDGRFKELADATKEAAAGVLLVEARSWANKAALGELVDKAVVGKVLQLMPTGGAK